MEKTLLELLKSIDHFYFHTFNTHIHFFYSITYKEYVSVTLGKYVKSINNKHLNN